MDIPLCRLLTRSRHRNLTLHDPVCICANQLNGDLTTGEGGKIAIKAGYRRAPKLLTPHLVLILIEAGWPGNLTRLTGVIFVPLTFRIERSWSR